MLVSQGCTNTLVSGCVEAQLLCRQATDTTLQRRGAKLENQKVFLSVASRLGPHAWLSFQTWTGLAAAQLCAFWLLLHLKSDSPWLRDVESFEGHEQPVSLALSCRRGTLHAMFQLVGACFLVVQQASVRDG